MTREEAIQHIVSLFPADSEYPATREKGIELLEEAKRNVLGWRNLPDEVLFKYAQLCIQEDNRQEREDRHKYYR